MEEKRVEYYHYLSDLEPPKLRKFVDDLASVFGASYVCEKAFPKLNYVKSTHRTKLIDEHIKAILLIGCSNSKSNIDHILKGKLQFHKSH